MDKGMQDFYCFIKNVNCIKNFKIIFLSFTALKNFL